MQSRSAKALILSALKEDAAFSDITSQTFIPKNSTSKTYIINKGPFVLCGIEIAKEVFKLLDKNIKFSTKHKDGEFLNKNTKVAEIFGNTQKILSAERTALNFLAHLSGVATLTKKFVDAIRPYPAKIMDTRKTTPGLRLLEKYAVKCGGGFNHRIGLSDQILIKDNHLKTKNEKCKAKNLIQIIKNIKEKKKVLVEIEVQSLKQFKEILPAQPDIIMLDNMTIRQIKEAIKIRGLICKHCALEVSGGINLKNIREYAKTGVDRISIGALTHSAPAIDFSLEF